MDYAALKAELTADPLGRGYASMGDQEIADSMNALTRTRNRASMSGSEVINSVVATEYAALTAANKQLLWDLVHLGQLNPFGVEATLMVSVFGAGSQTIAALAAKRVETVSRAQELGLERVSVGYIGKARAYGEA
jgi:hypothetical protein